MSFPKYHKIQSVFKRDPDNNYKTFLFGEFTTPEFEYLANATWIAQEKIDGTNTRILVDSEIGSVVGGRTDRAQLHGDLVAHLEDVGERAVEEDLDGLVLFGEGYGAGIQKGGGDYRQDKGFILFDVAVAETGVFLERENVYDIADKLDAPVAAEMARLTLNEAVNHFADNEAVPSVEKDGEAEGWVLRPTTELRGRTGKRIITKLKVKDFPERRTA